MQEKGLENNLTLGYIGQEATYRLEAGIIFKPDTPTMLGTGLGQIEVMIFDIIQNLRRIIYCCLLNFI